LVCQDPVIHVGETIPANTPALAVALVEEETIARLVEETASGDVERAVTLEDSLVRFVDALTPGSYYRLELATPCEGYDATTDEARFLVGEAEPFPNAVGTLVAHEPQNGGVTVATGGSCYSGVDAVSVDLAVNVDPALGPWDGLVVWETEVDGERWGAQETVSWGNDLFGGPSVDERPLFASWRGPGRDEVYASCGELAYGVGEGIHTAQLRARIPGTDVVLASNEVTFELVCPVPSTSGCSASNRARAGATPLIVLAPALILALRSRRRR
jgi:hypothetical protein